MEMKIAKMQVPLHLADVGAWNTKVLCGHPTLHDTLTGRGKQTQPSPSIGPAHRTWAACLSPQTKHRPMQGNGL